MREKNSETRKYLFLFVLCSIFLISSVFATVNEEYIFLEYPKDVTEYNTSLLLVSPSSPAGNAESILAWCKEKDSLYTGSGKTDFLAFKTNEKIYNSPNQTTSEIWYKSFLPSITSLWDAPFNDYRPSYLTSTSTYDVFAAYVGCYKSPNWYYYINVYPNSNKFNYNYVVNFTADSTSGYATYGVAFTIQNYSSVKDGLTTWDFGDGTISGGSSDIIYHSYYYEGNYTVLMYYHDWDDVGHTITKTNYINVTSGPIPPIPTPTPTPQTGTSTQWKITGKDVTNNTAISGLSISIYDFDDTAAGWFNVTASNGEYTFGGYGTGGIKPFVDNHNYLIVLSKTGYVIREVTATFSGTGLFSDTYMLELASYAPVTSTFTLGVKLYDNSNYNEILTPLTGSVTLSNQTGIWSSTTLNPQSGLVYFTGLTPSHSYKIDINLHGYQSYTGYFSSSSSMGNTNQNYYAYLIPTSELPSTYILNVNPVSGTFNDTYTLSIVGDLSNAKKISFSGQLRNSDTGAFYFNVGSYYSSYQYISGWKIWDGSAWQSSSLPQSISIKFPSSFVTGVYTVTAYITTNSDNTYEVTNTVNIVSQGNVKLSFLVWDGSKSFTQIFPYNLYLYDYGSYSWTNKTITSSSLYDGSSSISLNPNTQFGYIVKATGYQDYPYTLDSIVNVARTINVNLNPYSSLPSTNVTLSVNARRATDYLTLANIPIELSDGQTCYTNNNGYCSFTVLNNTYYRAYGDGSPLYMSTTSSTVTGTPETNIIFLNFMGVTQTTSIYPTLTPIGVYTTIPSATNYTMVTTNGTSCSSLSANATILDQLKNYIACNGVSSKEGQNAIIGLIIMLFAGAFLAKYAKGIGALAGIIAGAAVSFYMQLFPFWLLIFICVCAGIVFAAKIFGSDK